MDAAVKKSCLIRQNSTAEASSTSTLMPLVQSVITPLITTGAARMIAIGPPKTLGMKRRDRAREPRTTSDSIDCSVFGLPWPLKTSPGRSARQLIIAFLV